jgi:hypothetical protein
LSRTKFGNLRAACSYLGYNFQDRRKSFEIVHPDRIAVARRPWKWWKIAVGIDWFGQHSTGSVQKPQQLASTGACVRRVILYDPPCVFEAEYTRVVGLRRHAEIIGGINRKSE